MHGKIDPNISILKSYSENRVKSIKT